MRSAALFFARTSIAVWVGAAVLFVVVGISEVVHSSFESDIRDQLVVIRFPWFYRFGITLIALSLLATLAAEPGGDFSRRMKIVTSWLLAAALMLMIAEYFSVYLKLAELVTPPGKPRTPDFIAYHRASMWLNLANLGICTVAMALLNWPARLPANSPAAGGRV
jgi:hypothetical protein